MTGLLVALLSHPFTSYGITSLTLFGWIDHNINHLQFQIAIDSIAAATALSVSREEEAESKDRVSSVAR